MNQEKESSVAFAIQVNKAEATFESFLGYLIIKLSPSVTFLINLQDEVQRK